MIDYPLSPSKIPQNTKFLIYIAELPELFFILQIIASKQAKKKKKKKKTLETG